MILTATNDRSILEISHVSFLTLIISFYRLRTCYAFTLAVFSSYDSMICCAYLTSLCHWDIWLSNVRYDRSQGLGQRDSTHIYRPYYAAQVGNAANLYVYTNHTNPLNPLRFQHLASLQKWFPITKCIGDHLLNYEVDYVTPTGTDTYFELHLFQLKSTKAVSFNWSRMTVYERLP